MCSGKALLATWSKVQACARSFASSRCSASPPMG